MAAATDLKRPLIPPSDRRRRHPHPPSDDHPPPQLVLTINDHQTPNLETPTDQDPISLHLQSKVDHRLQESQENPYGFLGSDGFDPLGSTTVDPFKNQTPKIEGVYEWLKVLVCVPLALVRLLLCVLCLFFGYIATKSALHGWKDKQNPMPRWRCRVMWITRFCCRGILFSFGYQWIKRKGKPAPRDSAPILISNHVSYIDPIFFFYEMSPTIVASESHDSMPFVGTIIRAMQVIYVNRFSHQSRKYAVNEIKRKASGHRFPRLLLFPEGTTTNGRQLISFQLGAFIPGYPIQPVVIRYPHVHFDQSWGHIALATLMFRMFTQFHNFMEVEYLPVISPSEHHKGSAARFAERTGRAMACALNVVQTSHTFADYMLLSKAADSGQENLSHFTVEMSKIQKSCHLSTAEAIDFLDKFLAMNPDPSGHVKIQDFSRVLRLNPCGSLSQKIFSFVDVENNGSVTFKEFLVASAHVPKLPSFRRACEAAFAEIDADNDNYVSKHDFGASVIAAVPSLSTDEVQGLFGLFDADNDGRIDGDDFVTCLRKNPLLVAIFAPFLEHKHLYAASALVEEMG